MQEVNFWDCRNSKVSLLSIFERTDFSFTKSMVSTEKVRSADIDFLFAIRNDRRVINCIGFLPERDTWFSKFSLEEFHRDVTQSLDGSYAHETQLSCKLPFRLMEFWKLKAELEKLFLFLLLNLKRAPLGLASPVPTLETNLLIDKPKEIGKPLS